MQRIISQTPLRLSLFGGCTDYPNYYQRKPGATLGMTIDKHIYVSVNPVSHFFDYKLRAVYSKIEIVPTFEEIQHPSIRACLRHEKIETPLDIHISSDIPAKTGLGSSSAFTVGFLNALYAFRGIRVSKHHLAKTARHVEQQLIGESVGSQDQYHAAFGGLNVFEFSKEGVHVRPVVLSSERRMALEGHLCLFYTGLTRFAEEVIQEQLKNTNALMNDAALSRMYEMVFEAEEMLCNAPVSDMPKRLGHLLQESWNLKKNLSTQVSNARIDRAYEAALAAGAYGGKLCGAGGGGFLLFLAPAQAVPSIRQALQGMLEVDFHLDSQGSRIIYMKE